MNNPVQTGELRSPSLILGDCAEKMRDLAPNSIDAIVTDPPYGIAFMGSQWDNFGTNCGNDSAEERRRKASEYRKTHPGCGNYPNGHGVVTSAALRNFQSAMTPIFAEALRVAKPGAHLLAFGGSRAYHRLACAIEDAGWEVRDYIMWVYGSGFPKSMDVSKAIDKMMGVQRKTRNGKGEHEGNIDFGMKNRCPRCGKPYFSGNPCTCPREDNIPATPEAAAWQGWGTCLKPAYEPIIVARKPLDGTVAANVLKHGTGALNIDACRVPTDESWTHGATKAKPAAEYEGGWKRIEQEGSPLGRWPANLVHDGSPEVLACFPNDSARFFYCAKASRSERGEGNIHPTVKPIALMRWLVRLVTRKGGIVLDPFMGSGTTGVAAIQEGMGFIGIERDPHYHEIASRRISAAKPKPDKPTQQELPL